MTSPNNKYHFDTMEVGHSRFITCKVGERDSLRQSLYNASHMYRSRSNQDFYIKVIAEPTGIKYQRIEK